MRVTANEAANLGIAAQLARSWQVCLWSHSLHPPGSLTCLVWFRQLDGICFMSSLNIFLGSSFCLIVSESILIIYAWGGRALVNFASSWYFLKLLNHLYRLKLLVILCRIECIFSHKNIHLFIAALISYILRNFLQIGRFYFSKSWYITTTAGHDLQGLSIFTKEHLPIMFIVPLFTVSRQWNQLSCLSTDTRINETVILIYKGILLRCQ